MNSRTIVTVVAATLLSLAFAPMTSAQDNTGYAQEGIEIITIIGKRQTPTVTAACGNGMNARQDVVAESQNGDGNVGEDVAGSDTAPTNGSHRADRRCAERVATLFETHI